MQKLKACALEKTKKSDATVGYVSFIYIVNLHLLSQTVTCARTQRTSRLKRKVTKQNVTNICLTKDMVRFVLMFNQMQIFGVTGNVIHVGRIYYYYYYYYQR